jgi:hypothetical protein
MCCFFVIPGNSRGLSALTAGVTGSPHKFDTTSLSQNHRGDGQVWGKGQETDRRGTPSDHLSPTLPNHNAHQLDLEHHPHLDDGITTFSCTEGDGRRDICRCVAVIQSKPSPAPFPPRQIGTTKVLGLRWASCRCPILLSAQRRRIVDRQKGQPCSTRRGTNPNCAPPYHAVWPRHHRPRRGSLTT